MKLYYDTYKLSIAKLLSNLAESACLQGLLTLQVISNSSNQCTRINLDLILGQQMQRFLKKHKVLNVLCSVLC